MNNKPPIFLYIIILICVLFCVAMFASSMTVSSGDLEDIAELLGDWGFR